MVFLDRFGGHKQLGLIKTTIKKEASFTGISPLYLLGSGNEVINLDEKSGEISFLFHTLVWQNALILMVPLSPNCF